MRRLASRNLLLIAFAFVPPALADQGALSADIGAGLVAMSLGTPYAATGQSAGTALSVVGGAHYDVRNWLALDLSLFFEPPVAAGHRGVTVTTPDGDFSGTLNHNVTRYGGLVGARCVFGSVWRLSGGVHVGFSSRVYSGFQHMDDSNPQSISRYPFDLPNLTLVNPVVALVGGLEWAGGDHWSVSVLPRVSVLMGSASTIALTLPISFSWSWYL